MWISHCNRLDSLRAPGSSPTGQLDVEPLESVSRFGLRVSLAPLTMALPLLLTAHARETARVRRRTASLPEKSCGRGDSEAVPVMIAAVEDDG